MRFFSNKKATKAFRIALDKYKLSIDKNNTYPIGQKVFLFTPTDENIIDKNNGIIIGKKDKVLGRAVVTVNNGKYAVATINNILSEELHKKLHEAMNNELKKRNMRVEFKCELNYKKKIPSIFVKPIR